MGEHACEALPRFHLVPRHQYAYVLAQLVERAQQGSFARHPAHNGEAEGEIVVAHSFAHQMGAALEPALVVREVACSSQGGGQQES